MSKWLDRRPTEARYIVAYDPVDDKIYGVMELDTTDVDTDIAIHFFNDDGKIGLHIREITKAEFGTYVAFELFPILTPYDKKHIPTGYNTGSFDWGINFGLDLTTIYKVRFRDY